jgi:hypothetical protein
MNNGEREFPFSNVFTETFVIGVLRILKILIIVSDLKEDSDQIDKWNVIPVSSAYI